MVYGMVQTAFSFGSPEMGAMDMEKRLCHRTWQKRNGLSWKNLLASIRGAFRTVLCPVGRSSFLHRQEPHYTLHTLD
jgi:hypothetical protein